MFITANRCVVTNLARVESVGGMFTHLSDHTIAEELASTKETLYLKFIVLRLVL